MRVRKLGNKYITSNTFNHIRKAQPVHNQILKKNALQWGSMTAKDKIDWIDSNNRPQVLVRTYAEEKDRKLWIAHYKRGSKVVPDAISDPRPPTDWDAP